MSKLFTLLLSISMATMAGIAVVIVIVMGLDTMWPIMIAAAVGALLAVPVTWVVARKIEENEVYEDEL